VARGEISAQSGGENLRRPGRGITWQEARYKTWKGSNRGVGKKNFLTPTRKLGKGLTIAVARTGTSVVKEDNVLGGRPSAKPMATKIMGDQEKVPNSASHASPCVAENGKKVGNFADSQIRDPDGTTPRCVKTVSPENARGPSPMTPCVKKKEKSAIEKGRERKLYVREIGPNLKRAREVKGASVNRPTKKKNGDLGKEKSKKPEARAVTAPVGRGFQAVTKLEKKH